MPQEIPQPPPPPSSVTVQEGVCPRQQLIYTRGLRGHAFGGRNVLKEGAWPQAGRTAQSPPVDLGPCRPAALLTGSPVSPRRLTCWDYPLASHGVWPRRSEAGGQRTGERLLRPPAAGPGAGRSPLQLGLRTPQPCALLHVAPLGLSALSHVPGPPLASQDSDGNGGFEDCSQAPDDPSRPERTLSFLSTQLTCKAGRRLPRWDVTAPRCSKRTLNGRALARPPP